MMRLLDPLLKGLAEVRDELRGVKRGMDDSTAAVNSLHDLLIVGGLIAAGLFAVFILTKWFKK